MSFRVRPNAQITRRRLLAGGCAVVGCSLVMLPIDIGAQQGSMTPRQAFQYNTGLLIQYIRLAGGIFPPSAKRGWEEQPVVLPSNKNGRVWCTDRAGNVNAAWLRMGGEDPEDLLRSVKEEHPKKVRKPVSFAELVDTTVPHTLIGHGRVTHRPPGVCFAGCRFEAGWERAFAVAREFLAHNWEAKQKEYSQSLRGPYSAGRVLMFDSVDYAENEKLVEVFKAGAATRPLLAWIDQRKVAIPFAFVEPFVDEFQNQLEALPTDEDENPSLVFRGEEALRRLEEIGRARSDDDYFAALCNGSSNLGATATQCVAGRRLRERGVVASDPWQFDKEDSRVAAAKNLGIWMGIPPDQQEAKRRQRLGLAPGG